MRFLLYISILFLFSCGKNIERADVFYSEDDVAIEVGKDVEILYSDSAVVRVRIQAPTLHNHTTRKGLKQEFPDGVKVDFIGPDKRVRSVLTAKMATRNQETSLIVATDSVVVETVGKERLETEELIWNEKKQTLSTDKFVKITRPDEVFYGYGLDANQDFSYWKIKAPTGTLKSEQGF